MVDPYDGNVSSGTNSNGNESNDDFMPDEFMPPPPTTQPPQLTAAAMRRAAMDQLIGRLDSLRLFNDTLSNICKRDSIHDFGYYSSIFPYPNDVRFISNVEDKTLLDVLNNPPPIPPQPNTPNTLNTIDFTQLKNALLFQPNDNTIDTQETNIGVVYYPGKSSIFDCFKQILGLTDDTLKETINKDVVFATLDAKLVSYNERPINVLYDAGAGFKIKAWLSQGIGGDKHYLILDESCWLDPAGKIGQEHKNSYSAIPYTHPRQDIVELGNIRFMIIKKLIDEFPIYDVIDNEIIPPPLPKPPQRPKIEINYIYKNPNNGQFEAADYLKVSATLQVSKYPNYENIKPQPKVSYININECKYYILISYPSFNFESSSSEPSSKEIIIIFNNDNSIKVQGILIRSNNNPNGFDQIYAIENSKANTISALKIFQNLSYLNHDEKNFMKRVGDQMQADNVFIYNKIKQQLEEQRSTYLFTNDRMLVAYALLVGNIPLLFDTEKIISKMGSRDAGSSDTGGTDSGGNVLKFESNNGKILYYNPIEYNDEDRVNRLLTRLIDCLKKDLTYFKSYIKNYNRDVNIPTMKTINTVLSSIDSDPLNIDNIDNLIDRAATNIHNSAVGNIEKCQIFLKQFNKLTNDSIYILEIIKNDVSTSIFKINDLILRPNPNIISDVETQLNENYVLKKKIFCLSIFKNLSKENTPIIHSIKDFIVKCMCCFDCIKSLIGISVNGRGQQRRIRSGDQSHIKYNIPRYTLSILSNFINDDVLEDDYCTNISGISDTIKTHMHNCIKFCNNVKVSLEIINNQGNIGNIGNIENIVNIGNIRPLLGGKRKRESTTPFERESTMPFDAVFAYFKNQIDCFFLKLFVDYGYSDENFTGNENEGNYGYKNMKFKIEQHIKIYMKQNLTRSNIKSDLLIIHENSIGPQKKFEESVFETFSGNFAYLKIYLTGLINKLEQLKQVREPFHRNKLFRSAHGNKRDVVVAGGKKQKVKNLRKKTKKKKRKTNKRKIKKKSISKNKTRNKKKKGKKYSIKHK